ncbi:MAG TPA: polysaccharide biosynthesis/export family protein [Anaeromyxobacter sp.]|nr:polysaccharide biosynthesis/export family protein [Anaeromyxobacter sp.]
MNDTHRSSSLRGRRRTRAVVSLAFAALTLSCATHGEFIPIEQYPVATPESEYRIRRGDVVGIRVWNQESMSNAHARVRDDGRISVPFLQDVDVAGTTPSELSRRLQVMLKTYVVNPVVTVTVEEFSALKVSVLGEVAKPGQYDLDRGAGVLAALASAGGLSDYAHRDAIFVLRNSSPDGKPVRIRFRYAALVRAEKPAAIFRLWPDDVVVVE